jgi:hypothetical protein
VSENRDSVAGSDIESAQRAPECVGAPVEFSPSHAPLQFDVGVLLRPMRAMTLQQTTECHHGTP